MKIKPSELWEGENSSLKKAFDECCEPKYVSKCCRSEMKVVGSEEGTSYYECLSCGKPCDWVETKLNNCYTGVIENAIQKPDKQFKCKCGNELEPLHYCKKCGLGTFGDKKVIIVGEVGIKTNNSTDLKKRVEKFEKIINEASINFDETLGLGTIDKLWNFISSELQRERIIGYSQGMTLGYIEGSKSSSKSIREKTLKEVEGIIGNPESERFGDTYSYERGKSVGRNELRHELLSKINSLKER